MENIKIKDEPSQLTSSHISEDIEDVKFSNVAVPKIEEYDMREEINVFSHCCDFKHNLAHLQKEAKPIPTEINLADFETPNNNTCENFESNSQQAIKIEDIDLKEDFIISSSPSTSFSDAIFTEIHIQKRYQCDQCKRIFLKKNRLKAHIKERIECQRKYQCHHCKKILSRKDGLLSHIRHIHQKIAKKVRPRKPEHRGKYECIMCGKIVSSSNILLRHQKTHAIVKPFQCDHCSSSFRRMCHLRRHVQIHLEVKPYQCEICRKGFIRLSQLTSHNEKHHQDKQLPSSADSSPIEDCRPGQIVPKVYECKVCPKSFNNSGSLHNHIKSHG